ncbi:copper homeostasis protein CutC [Paenibacillus cellulositrophicus]|uniref:copper homeostasis protein CutC n=1 Tax=Paenibacillus cellulositrophicus TaxID=562959 RepID=UPI00203AEC50|nr:copper homeostasis protein CutC [Paenibacillus cellulositrophicus]
MKLEVIATNLYDALVAENAGADRLELVTGIMEGGLTPGPGMIRKVVGLMSIPVHVMVRPHSQSFVYDQYDLLTMREDIAFIKECGAAGIVLGTLKPDRTVDTEALEMLLKEADGLNVTFHRAFDEIDDQLGALRTLSAYPQINRILTSGGPRPAPESTDRIQALVEASAGTGIRILAGYGLTVPGLSEFVRKTGVPEVHFGSALRAEGNYLLPLDSERVKAAAQTVKSIAKSAG